MPRGPVQHHRALRHGYGREATQDILNQFAQRPRASRIPGDVRQMHKEIDAVQRRHPADFSHFPVTMLAMSQGSTSIARKAHGHSFRQLELMMAAEKKYKVACQMGNQGHSEANYFQFKAWVGCRRHQKRHQDHRVHE